MSGHMTQIDQWLMDVRAVLKEVRFCKSENIICLESYILNSFSYLDPISINVSQCMTSLLKLEIIVYFLAFIASSSRVTEED